MIQEITIFTAAFVFSHLLTFAQVSGNQAYGNGYDDGRNGNKNYVILQGDSAIVISANILLNSPADVYVVTLALSQDGKTIIECNDLIKKQIDDFKSSLKKLGVTEKDMYVDFISQTKIYDYTISGKTAEQVENGFEIKKNVTIRLNNPGDFDQLMIIASQHDIYDLVKVDYIINDTRKIYTQMMTAAADIINQKKQIYLQLASFRFFLFQKSTVKIFTVLIQKPIPELQSV